LIPSEPPVAAKYALANVPRLCPVDAAQRAPEPLYAERLVASQLVMGSPTGAAPQFSDGYVEANRPADAEAQEPSMVKMV
jgi:hypothetical protein